MREFQPNGQLSVVDANEIQKALQAHNEKRPYELPAGTRARLVVDFGKESKDVGLVSFDKPVEVVLDYNSTLLRGSVEEPIAVFRLDSKARRDAQKQQENAQQRLTTSIDPDDLINSLLYIKSQADTYVTSHDAVLRTDANLARDFLANSPHQLNEADEANVKAVELILITKRKI